MQQLETWLNQLGPVTPYVVIGFGAIFFAAIAYFLWNPILWVVHKLKEVTKGFWHIQLYTYPVIMGVVGSLMPDLHVLAGFSIPLEARGNVLVMCLIGGVFFLIQMFTANSPNTTLKGLIGDFLVSIFWGVGLPVTAGVLAVLGKLELWMVIPALFALLDLVVNTVITINNAYQRDPMAVQRAGT